MWSTKGLVKTFALVLLMDVMSSAQSTHSNIAEQMGRQSTVKLGNKAMVQTTHVGEDHGKYLSNTSPSNTKRQEEKDENSLSILDLNYPNVIENIPIKPNRTTEIVVLKDDWDPSDIATNTFSGDDSIPEHQRNSTPFEEPLEINGKANDHLLNESTAPHNPTPPLLTQGNTRGPNPALLRTQDINHQLLIKTGGSETNHGENMDSELHELKEDTEGSDDSRLSTLDQDIQYQVVNGKELEKDTNSSDNNPSMNKHFTRYRLTNDSDAAPQLQGDGVTTELNKANKLEVTSATSIPGTDGDGFPEVVVTKRVKRAILTEQTNPRDNNIPSQERKTIFARKFNLEKPKPFAVVFHKILQHPSGAVEKREVTYAAEQSSNPADSNNSFTGKNILPEWFVRDENNGSVTHTSSTFKNPTVSANRGQEIFEEESQKRLVYYNLPTVRNSPASRPHVNRDLSLQDVNQIYDAYHDSTTADEFKNKDRELNLGRKKGTAPKSSSFVDSESSIVNDRVNPFRILEKISKKKSNREVTQSPDIQRNNQKAYASHHRPVSHNHPETMEKSVWTYNYHPTEASKISEMVIHDMISGKMNPKSSMETDKNREQIPVVHVTTKDKRQVNMNHFDETQVKPRAPRNQRGGRVYNADKLVVKQDRNIGNAKHLTGVEDNQYFAKQRKLNFYRDYKTLRDGSKGLRVEDSSSQSASDHSKIIRPSKSSRRVAIVPKSRVRNGKNEDKLNSIYDESVILNPEATQNRAPISSSKNNVPRRGTHHEELDLDENRGNKMRSPSLLHDRNGKNTKFENKKNAQIARNYDIEDYPEESQDNPNEIRDYPEESRDYPIDEKDYPTESNDYNVYPPHESQKIISDVRGDNDVLYDYDYEDRSHNDDEEEHRDDREKDREEQIVSTRNNPSYHKQDGRRIHHNPEHRRPYESQERVDERSNKSKPSGQKLVHHPHHQNQYDDGGENPPNHPGGNRPRPPSRYEKPRSQVKPKPTTTQTQTNHIKQQNPKVEVAKKPSFVFSNPFLVPQQQQPLAAVTNVGQQQLLLSASNTRIFSPLMMTPNTQPFPVFEKFGDFGRFE